MKQKLIDQIRDAVKSIDGVCISEDPNCPYIVLVEEKEVLFTNSIGEEFKDVNEQLYPVWHYSLKDYSVQEATMYDIEFYNGIDSNGNVVFSEIYLTKETAYQKSIEYAKSQGESILYDSKSFGRGTVGKASGFYFDWEECYYSLAPRPEYRAWTMEDDEVDGLLLVKVRTKDYKEKCIITYINNEELEELFNGWNHMDGTPIGKKIN